MLVLGIDPGTATTGFGLVEYFHGREKLVDYGVISTPSHQPMPLRLHRLSVELTGLLQKYYPDAVAIEEIFYFKNSKTVISVAQGRGVAMLAAASAGIEVAEYTPLQVKQAVAGYGKADKKQIQFMVQKILKLPVCPKPDDAADALAIAICHLHYYHLKEKLQGQ
ncbi:MAG: crossover junction endodeoxyribonuclease RuvC [Syntrophomonadaceae bacterium]|jgi:crossover junction endodeoxyribonuclease RuvC